MLKRLSVELNTQRFRVVTEMMSDDLQLRFRALGNHRGFQPLDARPAVYRKPIEIVGTASKKEIVD